jgi:hypothetical protein
MLLQSLPDIQVEAPFRERPQRGRGRGRGRKWRRRCRRRTPVHRLRRAVDLVAAA